MITAEAAVESPIPNAAEAETAKGAPGAPELEEPAWPWVSPGLSGKGTGRVVQTLGLRLHVPAVPPAP